MVYDDAGWKFHSRTGLTQNHHESVGMRIISEENIHGHCCPRARNLPEETQSSKEKEPHQKWDGSFLSLWRASNFMIRSRSLTSIRNMLDSAIRNPKAADERMSPAG